MTMDNRDYSGSVERIREIISEERRRARANFYDNVYVPYMENGTRGKRRLSIEEQITRYDAEKAANMGFQADFYKTRFNHYHKYLSKEESKKRALKDVEAREKDIENNKRPKYIDKQEQTQFVPEGSITQGPVAGHENAYDIAYAKGRPVRDNIPKMVTLVDPDQGRVDYQLPDGTEVIDAHMSGITAVEGTVIPPGQVEGLVNMLGRADNPHLHRRINDGKQTVRKGNATKDNRPRQTY